MNINSLDFISCVFQREEELNKTMGSKKYHHYHRKFKNGNSVVESKVMMWNSNSQPNGNHYSFDVAADYLMQHVPFLTWYTH